MHTTRDMETTTIIFTIIFTISLLLMMIGIPEYDRRRFHNSQLVKAECTVEIHSTHCVLMCSVYGKNASLYSEEDCFWCEKGKHYCWEEYGVLLDGKNLVITKYLKTTALIIFVSISSATSILSLIAMIWITVENNHELTLVVTDLTTKRQNKKRKRVQNLVLHKMR